MADNEQDRKAIVQSPFCARRIVNLVKKEMQQDPQSAIKAQANTSETTLNELLK